MDCGLGLLQNGLDVTGENALIYAGIAHACFHYTNLDLEQEKNFKRSEEFVKKALELDPELAEAQFVYGNIMMIF